MKRKKETHSDDTQVLVLKGSVFAQLGLPDADDLLRKSRLFNVISDTIKERKLTQAAAAEAMGVDQADVSRISNGKLDRFSLERLMTMIHRLGVDIELVQTRDQEGYLVVNVRRLAASAR